MILTKLKISLFKRKWIKDLDYAIQALDYELAKDIATELQDASYYYWVKRKPIPFWIKKCLSLFNYYFGWIKQEKDNSEEFE